MVSRVFLERVLNLILKENVTSSGNVMNDHGAQPTWLTKKTQQNIMALKAEAALL